MQAFFNEPQRQSLLSILVFLTGNIQGILRSGIAFLILIFFMLRNLIENPFWRIAFIITAISLLVLFMLVYAIIQYRNFVFHMDYENAEFHLNQGVFQKKSLSFHTSQIQQVYIERKWIQRILGLSSLKIEVAGGQSEAIALPALSTGMANALLGELKMLQKGSEIFTPPAFDLVAKRNAPNDELSTTANLAVSEPKSIQIPLINLLKNATVTRILNGLFLIFLPLQFLGYDITVWIFDYLESSFALQIIWGPVIIISLLLVAILLAILLNVILTLFQHFNLTIKEVEKNQYQLSQGLVNLKMVQIKPQRIQMVTIEQNYLQKKMGLYTLIVRQLQDLNTTQNALGIRIPGINETQLNTLVSWGFLPASDVEFAQTETIRPLKRKFWIQSIFITLMVWVPVLIAINAYGNWVWMILLAGLTLWLVLEVWYFKMVKSERFYFTENQMWLQKGVWKKTNTYMLIPKVQTMRSNHFFWQKKFIHVSVGTAGGGMNLTFYPQRKWRLIEGKILYILESKNPPWY